MVASTLPNVSCYHCSLEAKHLLFTIFVISLPLLDPLGVGEPSKTGGERHLKISQVEHLALFPDNEK